MPCLSFDPTLSVGQATWFSCAHTSQHTRNDTFYNTGSAARTRLRKEAARQHTPNASLRAQRWLTKAMCDRRHRQCRRRALKRPCGSHYLHELLGADAKCFRDGSRGLVFFRDELPGSVHRASRQHCLHLHQIWRDLRAHHGRGRGRGDLRAALFARPTCRTLFPRARVLRSNVSHRPVLLNGSGSRITCAGVLSLRGHDNVLEPQAAFCFPTHPARAAAQGPWNRLSLLPCREGLAFVRVPSLVETLLITSSYVVMRYVLSYECINASKLSSVAERI